MYDVIKEILIPEKEFTETTVYIENYLIDSDGVYI